jgi:hypothetical protein
MITVPPGRKSSTLARSAAGLNATSTSGWSAGVRTSLAEKWIWKPETPASVPAGRGSRRGSRAASQVVARERRGFGELGAGELDAITRVATKTDRYTFDLLGGLPHCFAHHPPWTARPLLATSSSAPPTRWAKAVFLMAFALVRLAERRLRLLRGTSVTHYARAPGWPGWNRLYQAQSGQNPQAASPRPGPPQTPLRPATSRVCLRAQLSRQAGQARRPAAITPASGRVSATQEGLHACTCR